MTINITHNFVSSKPDSGDSSRVNASDWNADHILTLSQPGIAGRGLPMFGDASALRVVPAAALATGVLTVTSSNPSLLAHTVFISSGTWTKAAGTRFVVVHIIGGGGGGGGGPAADFVITQYGGYAASGAGAVVCLFDADMLGATESVTVGAGGTGGAGITAGNLGSGLEGTPGGGSWFGTWRYATPGMQGIGGIRNPFSAPSGLNVATVYEVGFLRDAAFSPVAVQQPGAGGVFATRKGGGWPWCPFAPGGGGYPGSSLGGAGSAGSRGYGSGESLLESNVEYGNGGAGGAIETNGSAGTSRTGTGAYFGCGDGGGGGGTGFAANAGNGGDGGAPGGGGGGGAPGSFPNASGNGGNGGRGEVRVWEYG